MLAEELPFNVCTVFEVITLLLLSLITQSDSKMHPNAQFEGFKPDQLEETCLCVPSDLDFLTGVLWIHMRRVEAEVDKEGNGDSELEPLHHIGGLLAIQGRGHVTPQDHALTGARRHKPGLLSHSVGTWVVDAERCLPQTEFLAFTPSGARVHARKKKKGAAILFWTEFLQTKQKNVIASKSFVASLHQRLIQSNNWVSIKADRPNYCASGLKQRALEFLDDHHVHG